jgi:hypothetical protein
VSTTNIRCFQCEKPFNKKTSEYNRTERLGKHHFCSRSCSATYKNKTQPVLMMGNLVPHVIDSFAPFRYFIRMVKQRSKNSTIKENNSTGGREKRDVRNNISVEYLLELYESCKGICEISGVQMVLPESTKGWSGGRNPYNASLDRIVPDKGYTKGNVRFISLIANYAKNEFEDSILLGFCKSVVDHKGLNEEETQ